jgi:hypothetical protein
MMKNKNKNKMIPSLLKIDPIIRSKIKEDQTRS